MSGNGVGRTSGDMLRSIACSAQDCSTAAMESLLSRARKRREFPFCRSAGPAAARPRRDSHEGAVHVEEDRLDDEFGVVDRQKR